MRWTYARVKELYTRMREKGSCSKCGRKGVTIGRHPSGRRGQPLTHVKSDRKALKEWVRAAGWLCPSCSRAGGDTTTEGETGNRKKLKEERANLRRLVKKYTKPVMRLGSRRRIPRPVSYHQYWWEVAQKRLAEAIGKPHEEFTRKDIQTKVEEGVYVDPEVLRGWTARLAELDAIVG